VNPWGEFTAKSDVRERKAGHGAVGVGPCTHHVAGEERGSGQGQAARVGNGGPVADSGAAEVGMVGRRGRQGSGGREGANQWGQVAQYRSRGSNGI
jgi:hypothetical protein